MPNTTISDPLLRHAETPLHGVFYPLGFRLEIETNDQRVLDCAEAAYGLFSTGEDSAPLRLRAICAPGATPGPHTYRAHRDFFTAVAGPDNFLICDVERREATGFFTDALLDDRETFREAFLDAFTYMTLQRHWLTPFHAACIVFEGVGICLAGGSGSGKSTLSYAALKAGFGLLSDNSVSVLNSDVARGFRGNPARLRLRPSACELFPELRGMPTGEQSSGKPFIAAPARELFPSQMFTHAKAGPVVFLERGDDGRPALSDIPESEAIEMLFADRNPNIDEPHVMAASQTAISRVVRNGAYRMHYRTYQEALSLLQRTTQ
jgi:hypothetical protein